MPLHAAPPALGEETFEPNEDALVDRLTALHREAQESDDAKRRPAPHGQHPKHQGCVRAEFVVENDVPEPFRHGLFAQPQTFQALIRFSNGRSDDDRVPDGHGMAVKLLGVSGPRAAGSPEETTHDLIMINHPVFFVKNLTDYLPILEDLRNVKAPGVSLAKARSLFKLFFSQDYRYRMLRAIPQRIDCPLRIQYWSTTPYKLGDGAMKFSARPLQVGPPAANSNGKDRLRDAMRAHLSREPARFEFLAQRQTDAERMPIEDPTIAWDADRSPWTKVATIVIPPQTFETPELMSLAEHLSFNPWNALAAHRPLGGVNRSRRKIYEAISRRRHELNGAPLVEPK